MTKKKNTKHFFIDGFSPRDELLGLLAYPYALKNKDAEYATFYTVKNGQWKHKNFDFDSRSITYIKKGDYASWWILGKRGEVVELNSEGIRHEKIPDAGTGADGSNKLGYVNKIVNIDNQLFVCGYGRQVYKRENESWIHIDQEILHLKDEDGISFSSMHGTSCNKIYAVGNHGEIWHYNGKSWKQISLAIKEHLHEVICINDELIYACGNKGIVVKGYKGKWEVLQNTNLDDFWGLAYFQNNIYVAGFKGITQIKNNKIVPVDLGLNTTITNYRLCSSNDKLWSIGEDHILCFDGTKWEEMICPDNK